MSKLPSAGSKDTVLMAISSGPSFNYTSHKKDAVAGYTLYSFIDNAEATAEHTFFNGQPAYLLDQTTQPKCFGDAAGRGGGVKSGTVGGEVKPISGSSTIFIEGKALVREGGACTMNNGNVKGMYVTVDAAQAEQIMAQWANQSTEQAVADGGLWADSGGGLLSGIGPSNQDIIDFTGIPKDKIDAVGNTAAGFNQMWTFGVSDVLFGAPDPNKASTKAGQVAGMAVLSSTGASSAPQVGKAVQAITKTATRSSVRTFHKVTGHKYVSTGRTQASNVTERIAMEEVRSNPRGKDVSRMIMSDTKNGLHAKDGWVKRSQTVRTSKGKVEVHYAHNTNTGKNVDFKYKNPPLKD